MSSGWSEKRGKFWRARWRAPDGNVPSVSGFLTEKAADKYWQRQVADIDAHRYIDPKAGQILFEDWVNDHWVPTWDLELSSEANYQYHLECSILPYFTGRSLAAIAANPQDVDSWEREIARETSASTANTSRAVLTSCLAAAVPHRIPVNPALRKRATGKKATRRVARIQSRQVAWATPLQVFLVAERVATLTGRDEDFVLIVSIAYTGMRWSEAIGLHPDLIEDGKWALNWKLYELNGQFYRQYPKDGSIRNVDTPPFLDALIATLLDGKNVDCGCKATTPAPFCQGGKFVFLGPSGAHARRSNFARDSFKPAAHGRHPAEGGKRPRPSMPVLADVSGTWMGVPLVTKVPDGWSELAERLVAEMAAQGVTKRKHATGAALIYAKQMDALQAAGPYWPSLAHQRTGEKRVVNSNSRRGDLVAHAIARGIPDAEASRMTRRELLARFSADVAVSAWLPIVPKLTPHGLRHGLETWMAEDRIADVLRDERMGHGEEEDGAAPRRSSMRDHYTKISSVMRQELVDALQRRWEEALMERVALEAHWPQEFRRSPVAIVNSLLEPYRDATVSGIGRKARRKVSLRSRPRRISSSAG